MWDEAKPDHQTREQLVTMLITGGAHTVSAAEARLYELLEHAGVFLVGGVLVCSHAFAIYGNMLGINWPSKFTQTHEVDITRTNHIILGVRNEPANLKQALLDANMGFVEVPALDRKCSFHTFSDFR